MMKKIIFIICLGINIFNRCYSDEGMWQPYLLSQINLDHMIDLGFQLSKDDIYSINNNSLKDAIVHFNGGCTASIISNRGLVLTNHHCGYSQIQANSSIENNLLENGFSAKNLNEELPNENLYVSIVKYVKDVTNEVNFQTNDNNLNQKYVIDSIIKKEIENTNYDAIIKPFYKGNQYYLFVYEKFYDIRLVNAPPSSIGKFGSDTDNWVWPRHTGDYSIFRIYVNKENKPAIYNKENIPLKTDNFLKISTRGFKENDFAMVYGFPGSTNEYLPSCAIEHLKELNEHRIEIRKNLLNVLDFYMKKSDQIKLNYSSKYASISNYYKKWKGENLGIFKSNAIQNKIKFEKSLMDSLKKYQKYQKYDIINKYDSLYNELRIYSFIRSTFIEKVYKGVDFFGFTNNISKKILNNESDSNLISFTNKHFNSYSKEIDEDLFKELIIPMVPKNNHKLTFDDEIIELSKSQDYEFEKGWNYGQKKNNYSNISNEIEFDSLKKLEYTVKYNFLNIYPFIANEKLFNVKNIFEKSIFTDRSKILKLINNKNKVKVKNIIKNDKAYILTEYLFDFYFTKISPTYWDIRDQISELDKKYIKLLMDIYPNKNYYPDANGTLRLSYGEIKKMKPRDAVTYNYITYLDGMIEKYIPNDYEFDLPEKILNIYKYKNYGKYAIENKLPLCFISTNHTTGGNSGSPVLDSKGHLIGLNFDRLWEGTMSDVNFDPKLCRNIMVDIRFILFMIDNYHDSKNLINELEIFD